MFSLNKIVRANIIDLKPYSSAREEYKGKEGIFLDANENSFGSPLSENYNRYPDPRQVKLKEVFAKLKNVSAENIFLGNGSDEAIDLCFRAFCVPGKSNVIVCPPTYGMYEVAAAINDIEAKSVPLLPEIFQLDLKGVGKAIDGNTRLLFLCSPNNPTGNVLRWNDIKELLCCFEGVVVLDEAYVDFSKSGSMLGELMKYPNLLILQTMSKAWGLAGLRLGMAFGSKEIIDIFNKIKSPYNVNALTQQLVIEAVSNIGQMKSGINEIVGERERLRAELEKNKFILKVFPSESNFLLVRFSDAKEVYSFLVKNEMIVRDRTSVELCEECLRITIGKPVENDRLLEKLREYNLINIDQ